MRAQLWLVRHGQTDWNLAGRFQGHADVPLNDTGRRQAGDLRHLLSGQRFDALYVSDLKRARQTAEPLIELSRRPPRLDRRLREVHHGSWEGLLRHEIIERFPEIWAERARAPHLARPPGGETIVEVAGRVASAMDEIASRHRGGRVLVVSHGVALATALCRVGRQPLQGVLDQIPSNAEPCVVTWPPAPEVC